MTGISPSKKLISFSILLFLQSCQPTPSNQENAVEVKTDSVYLNIFSQLPDNEAGKLVSESINEAGGWENWTQKRSLNYTKIITYFDSLGNETRKVTQLHQYNLFPSFKARITWNEGKNEYKIINNGQQAWKFENGSRMTDQPNINSAYNSSYGSHYVMCMPYKLADPGCQLEYEGTTKLPDGREARKIKVTYAEGAGSAAKYHTWWYYFDPETKELVANVIFDGSGYSYTEYESFVEIDELTFNQARASYETDSVLTTIQLSTRYENEDISLGELHPDDFFEPENDQ